MFLGMNILIIDSERVFKAIAVFYCPIVIMFFGMIESNFFNCTKGNIFSLFSDYKKLADTNCGPELSTKLVHKFGQ